MAISIGIGNYISRGLIKGGGIKPIFPEGLIARYACYDKTNEDEDRDVLKDLSGNGHDIQLYNFAFSKNSGYGMYYSNYTTKETSLVSVGVRKGVARNVTYYSFEYKPYKIDDNTNIGYGVYIRTYPTTEFDIIMECSNIDDTNPIYIVPYNRTVEQQGFKIKLQNGINYLHISYLDKSYPYFTIVSENINYKSFVSFKTIPNYKGALVSDGVDDYGLCENFPILDRDRGYTICAIRNYYKGISNTLGYLFTNASSSQGNDGFCQFERNNTTSSFGQSNQIEQSIFGFSYQKSSKYNNSGIVKGNAISTDKIAIFKRDTNSNNYYLSCALYALEIYDRDLTNEEIAQVKARMIAEYEAKTGEKYVEL